MVNLNHSERYHHRTEKYINHVNTRLVLQMLPLEIIPQGSQRTERQRVGGQMGKEGGKWGGIRWVKKKTGERKSLSIKGIVWVCYGVVVIKGNKQNV